MIFLGMICGTIIINLQPTGKGSKSVHCTNLRKGKKIASFIEILKNKKTNNSGVWVKGDDGNQNENVDYFERLGDSRVGVLGLANQRIVLFNASGLIQLQSARDLKQHNIIEVKHTRKYEAYDPFIIAQNVKQKKLIEELDMPTNMEEEDEEETLKRMNG
ncbi:hypothetical protein H5410_003810 [Solanum commersonii]|uniref:Uncharacterized protein n=1 Tax=Solanum commersonii TaxID=4109 RepID=A0A9J6B5N6_SOLCO|nr:hypothetical protein H5410_003810 [Solanum commersonii]